MDTDHQDMLTEHLKYEFDMLDEAYQFLFDANSGRYDRLREIKFVVNTVVESFWTHAIERNPNSLTAYYNLGNHFYTMRQLDRALPLYERASQMDSDNGRALNAYLWTLDFLRGTGAVVDACRARLQQAEDAERAGRQREALRIYQQLKVGAPKYVKECDTAEALQRLGEAH